MDRLNEYRDLIYKILSYYASIPYRYGDIKTYVIVDNERNHFLMMHEGWEGKRRIHGAIVHVEICDEKIWIHYDGIEEGITDELVAGGVPKDHIVLAFHPPYVREHTGYAVSQFGDERDEAAFSAKLNEPGAEAVETLAQ